MSIKQEIEKIKKDVREKARREAEGEIKTNVSWEELFEFGNKSCPELTDEVIELYQKFTPKLKQLVELYEAAKQAEKEKRNGTIRNPSASLP